MIFGKITDSQRIESLHPLFKKLFDYVKTHDLAHMEAGRIDLEGDSLFIKNGVSNLKKKEDQILEIHHRYIDVHIPLTGVETIGWLPTDELTEPKEPFNETKDIGKYAQPASTYFQIKPGEFCICFPEDAHAPVIGEGSILKATAKVLL